MSATCRLYANVLLLVASVWLQVCIGTAIPINYYNETNNAISCAGDMELTACHRNCGIQTTCEELYYGENFLGERNCASVCHPGCQCPQRNGEDTYLTFDDRCVTKFECGCVHRGVFHGMNERFFRGSLLCSCDKGRTLCNSIFGWLIENKATEVWPDDGSAMDSEKSSVPESISFEFSSLEFSSNSDDDEAFTLNMDRQK
ncbi:alpha-tectorin-like [Anneissia japonica]|uniref:alpha-tectorin-like n=1 Tax=Anneissia japonica TaxID=1529436 RepID=UPI001425BA2E|nr:alpha-tectorin-like [Anneissia japonica]